MFDLSPVPVPDLTGRTILVTGAGQGIGAVLAGMLAANGANVFAGAKQEVSQETADMLSATTILELDVTRTDQVQNAISTVSKTTGKLDVLVNNAGTIAPIGLVETIMPEDMLATFDTNVVGILRLIRAALPMLEQSKGTVLNAGTGAATTAMKGWTAYCTTKASARMLTLMCELELADRGIKNFFLGIPPTDTSMQEKIRASGLNPISRISQHDLIRPEVPASVMAFLCGSEACRSMPTLLDVRDDRIRHMMVSDNDSK